MKLITNANAEVMLSGDNVYAENSFTHSNNKEVPTNNSLKIINEIHKS